MPSANVTIPDSLHAEIQRIAERQRRTFDSVAGELLEEAVRMHRIPGIVFADGPAGRRARIAGTGLDVFEIILMYKELGQNVERLAEEFDWLTPAQLRAAVNYWQVYPEEIEACLQREADWTPERVWERYPFMKPPWA